MKTKEKRQRWTILDPDEQAIKIVKKYAKKHGYTVGKALSVIIYKIESEV